MSFNWRQAAEYMVCPGQNISILSELIVHSVVDEQALSSLWSQGLPRRKPNDTGVTTNIILIYIVLH